MAGARGEDGARGDGAARRDRGFCELAHGGAMDRPARRHGGGLGRRDLRRRYARHRLALGLVSVLALLMIGVGGWDTIQESFTGARVRSYFGVYTVTDYPQTNQRRLAHGTTLHEIGRAHV